MGKSARQTEKVTVWLPWELVQDLRELCSQRHKAFAKVAAAILTTKTATKIDMGRSLRSENAHEGPYGCIIALKKSTVESISFLAGEAGLTVNQAACELLAEGAATLFLGSPYTHFPDFRRKLHGRGFR